MKNKKFWTKELFIKIAYKLGIGCSFAVGTIILLSSSIWWIHVIGMICYYMGLDLIDMYSNRKSYDINHKLEVQSHSGLPINDINKDLNEAMIYYHNHRRKGINKNLKSYDW